MGRLYWFRLDPTKVTCGALAVSEFQSGWKGADELDVSDANIRAVGGPADSGPRGKRSRVSGEGPPPAPATAAATAAVAATATAEGGFWAAAAAVEGGVESPGFRCLDRSCGLNFGTLQAVVNHVAIRPGVRPPTATSGKRASARRTAAERAQDEMSQAWDLAQLGTRRRRPLLGALAEYAPPPAFTADAALLRQMPGRCLGPRFPPSFKKRTPSLRFPFRPGLIWPWLLAVFSHTRWDRAHENKTREFSSVPRCALLFFDGCVPHLAFSLVCAFDPPPLPGSSSTEQQRPTKRAQSHIHKHTAQWGG
eukprot:CAMPEP_0172595198 /NCGR_PEP_ID=MMETSP1068-20121228/14776_1 /TAXON_ID=35684 /ORGANISM="Pseudopedinella elastica, Strain CCMP716" /LENGTH=307 /DNA_ID=CAMNT_0013393633 /DNA_START=801 /DNA_END=1721 /DNA_ORIENTATION=+